MTDWADAISRMVAAQRQVHVIDREHLWRHEQPAPPASRELLGLVEARRGVTLDSQYAEFLLHADGWPAFMQDVDLFGTSDLLGEPFDGAVQLLSTLEPEVVDASDLDVASLIPIGASRTDIDLFVMAQSDGSAPTPVIWLAGLEVERYVSFEEFFQAMIEENLSEAADLRERQQDPEG
ncbi:SMI1/KNR4 family protein [Streptomyces sp. NPDC093591]|uniref:SMI1/KNR4 family protein n=1 Tax=Streptomyces sp. NPDC093591 TaxID=3366044 RepID=UPI0038186BF3